MALVKQAKVVGERDNSVGYPGKKIEMIILNKNKLNAATGVVNPQNRWHHHQRHKVVKYFTLNKNV